MKKIMFNDKYRLTQAVLEGRKTQTRRLIKCRKTFKGEWVAGFNIHIRPSDKKVVGLPCMYDADESEFDGGEILPRYKVGEVAANTRISWMRTMFRMTFSHTVLHVKHLPSSLTR